MDAAGLNRFVERDRNRGGGGIAIFVEVDEYLVGTRVEPFGHGVDDAAIRLMRDNAFDAGNVDFAAAHSFFRRGLHCLHGILEGLFSFHSQVMHAGINRLRGSGTTAAAPRHE